MRFVAYRVALAVFIFLSASRHNIARAASPEEQAQVHYDRGTVFFNLGQFEDAIAEYRKGYEQKAYPGFLFNIATAYGQLGIRDKALFFYRRYVATAPEAPNRKEVEQRIAELERGASGTEPRTPPAPVIAPPPPRVPTAPPANRPDLTAVLPPAPVENRPIWQRGWFWAGAGGIALGAAVIALVAITSGSNKTSTDLGTARFF